MPELIPLVLGDALLPISFNDCGCCEGREQQTPIALFNRPELSAVGYRVGTHARFMETMLARLSSPEFPALADLRTRDQDDFSIALLDGWATISDILAFYQERIANESYLRTATERRSIIELAKLIGYRPHPGIAASTLLAFFLAEALGAPDQAIKRTKIPRATRVQSVPGPGETPQTFETVEDIDARLEWNVLRPRMTTPQVLTKQSKKAYLKGTDTGLKKGDPILFVGEERGTDPNSDHWDLRFLSSVKPDHPNGRTFVEWATEDSTSELRSVASDAGKNNPKVYALRVRASLFGYNAPHPRVLHESIQKNYGFGTSASMIALIEFRGFSGIGDWKFNFDGSLAFHLDTTYPTIVPGSWIVLSHSSVARLFEIEKITEDARTDFTLSSKTTRVTVDRPELPELPDALYHVYRDMTAYAESQELALADAPIDDAIWGDEIILDRRIAGLQPGHTLIVNGKVTLLFQKLFFVAFTPEIFSPALSATSTVALSVLAKPLVTSSFAPGTDAFQLKQPDVPNGDNDNEDEDQSASSASAQQEDEVAAELVTLKEAKVENGLTKLVFSKPLAHAYERTTLEILGNVAPANHGETVNEILGSGDASQPHQRFTLKQKPLTYVSATNPRGAESTLDVRVNDVLWKEVPTLYGRGSRDRVYTTDMDDEGKVSVLFGDGVNGARLPTGQNNVRATYRKGIGLGGQVAADQISLLMSRPLGVQSVVNPIPATGAADPESRDDARGNAPVTVLTLDRVVSLRDYEDFARSFAGVAKALATWSWDGARRRVCITVAGPAGATIEEGGTLHNNLVSALRAAGDPFVGFAIKSFRSVAFLLKIKVKVLSDYLPEKVLPQVEQGLRTAFGFAARALGQPVHLSEVIAIVEQVTGVEAVDVDRLYRESAPNAIPMLFSRLPAERPILGSDDTIKAAELLTLHTGPLAGLELMP